MLTEYVFNAVIYNVVDGDTVDAEIDLGFKIKTKQRLRLANIDTPERGQPGHEEAKTELSNMVLSRQVQVETYKTSKFGYFLADIMVDGMNVNGMLVAKGLAKQYTGGPK